MPMPIERLSGRRYFPNGGWELVMAITRSSRRRALLASASVIAGSTAPHLAAADAIFTPGDLVISTVSCSVVSSICNSTSGGLDTAAPIVLDEFSLGGGTPKVPVATLTLPIFPANTVRHRKVSFSFRGMATRLRSWAMA
jgi:hypothetical protein